MDKPPETHGMTPQPNHPEFEAMLVQSTPALARIARRYAGPHEQQDLFQDICLQLWRAFKSFDGRAQLSTWVYRVALNTAISHVRKPRREHVSLESAPEPSDGGSTADAMGALDAFLASLEPVPRSILLLDLEGCAREQIAEVLGLTPNAVAVRMTRLRQAFKQTYVGDTP